MVYDKFAEVLLKLDGKERPKNIADCLSDGFYDTPQVKTMRFSPHSNQFLVMTNDFGEIVVVCSNHLQLALNEGCKLYDR